MGPSRPQGVLGDHRLLPDDALSFNLDLPWSPGRRFVLKPLCLLDDPIADSLLAPTYVAKIDTFVAAYNARLKPKEDLDPDWIRAMIEQETGSSPEANRYDPMQVANKGDAALTCLREAQEHSELVSTPELRTKLAEKEHTPRDTVKNRWDYAKVPPDKRMDAVTSVEAGIAWLFHKAAKYEEVTVETDPRELEHKVAPGDNLDTIAKTKQTTVDTLAKMNGWQYRVEGNRVQVLDSKGKPAILKAGQVLKYKKAKRQWIISGWRSWDEATARYNGGGVKDYAKEVQGRYKKINGEL